MAMTMSFADWRQVTNDNLMTTAESLLDKLEDVAELLTKIDQKYIMPGIPENNEDESKESVVQRFHDGLGSARVLVGAIKREKWRLNKREMSVEMKMGELEDYKSHLKDDVSSLNQTVDALSLRIVQQENQLAEAQEMQESLEAEVAEYKGQAKQTTKQCTDFKIENEKLRKEVRLYKDHTSQTLATENQILKNENQMLQDENHRLKELVRSAEIHPNQTNDNDHLARLTRDFLKHLSRLDSEEEAMRYTTPESPNETCTSAQEGAVKNFNNDSNNKCE